MNSIKEIWRNRDPLQSNAPKWRSEPFERMRSWLLRSRQKLEIPKDEDALELLYQRPSEDEMNWMNFKLFNIGKKFREIFIRPFWINSLTWKYNRANDCPFLGFRTRCSPPINSVCRRTARKRTRFSVYAADIGFYSQKYSDNDSKKMYF